MLPSQPAGPLFASATVPGLGQLLVGRRRSGVIFLLLLLVLVCCFYTEAIADHYVRWVVASLALIALWVASPLEYVLHPVEAKSPVTKLLILALPLACIAGACAVSASMIASHHRPYKTLSTSMAPTIYADDSFFVDERYYRHHPLADGDIIAFRHGDFMIIKRISALPGETIQGKNDVLIRNNIPLVEPYAHFTPDFPNEGAKTFARTLISTNEIFVTGDSRDQSLDSRIAEFGEARVSDVVGKVTFVYASKHDQTGRNF